MMKVVRLENLTRVYVSSKGFFKREKIHTLAVDHISFEVEQGELFGVLGPNGAGKTTTIKLLTTLLLPTDGQAFIMDHNVATEAQKVRRVINVIYGGERGLYPRLTARQNLQYAADLYNVETGLAETRINELLSLVGLHKRADERVENFSRGMKQRLHIARGLINNPEILFMDEPTIGLDPEAAHDLRQTVKRLTGQGKTIFLTTHDLWEADQLCDRIAILQHGKVIALDTPRGLRGIMGDFQIIEVETFDMPGNKRQELESALSENPISIANYGAKQTIKIQTTEPNALMAQVKCLLEDVKILDMRIREQSLEDAYLSLVRGG